MPCGTHLDDLVALHVVTLMLGDFNSTAGDDGLKEAALQIVSTVGTS